MKKTVKHKEIYKKCFPGVNANHLNHYVLPKLSEDQPDAVIIHVGINDIINGTDHNDLVSQINNIALTCKNYGI